MGKKEYLVPSHFRAIEIDEEVCTGCHKCEEICSMDVFAPNTEKGKPPIVAFPEDCWFCGCCLDDCPVQDKGAIRVVIPLPMRVAAFQGRRT
ncbi:ferredoxin family protein [bacterium]|nr:ferredoxin family protein [bacterium]